MLAHFPGFAAADLAFLTGLAAHNDREWFTANRAVYDERLKPALAALIDALNAAFAARDLPLAGDPKKSVFRIHRDVRFSKDKRPYKTHVSATLTRDGQKLSPGLVYVHIEPEGGPARPSTPRPSTRWIPRPCRRPRRPRRAITGTGRSRRRAST